MSLSALDYRKRRGLDKRDEQMALLVQRVSGSYYGYLSCHGSRSWYSRPFLVFETIDKAEYELVMVLERAVDHTEGSYRLVGLDMPQATSCTTIAEKHQFSQRKVEAVDTSGHYVRQMYLDQIKKDSFGIPC